MKIWQKLVIVLITLAVIIIALFSLMFLQETRKALVMRTEEQLSSISALKIGELNQYINSKVEQEELISDLLPEKYTMFDKMNESTKQEARDWLNDRLRGHTGTVELFLINSKGEVAVSSTPEQEGKMKTTEPYFVYGQHKVYSQKFYFSLSLRHPSFVIAGPLYYHNKTTGAVMAYRLNLDPFEQIMNERTGLRSTGETFLVNQYHYLVTSARFESSPTLQKSIFTEAVGKCLGHNKGTGQFIDYRGVSAIIHYEWVSDMDVCLISKIDSSEALESLTQLRLKVILIAALIIAGVSLFAVVASKYYSRSVNQLVAGTQAIATGNLAFKVDVKTKDELAELGKAFNKMALDLKRYKETIAHHSEELEHEVHQRTAQLKRQVQESDDAKQATLNILEDVDEEHKNLLTAQDRLNKYVEELRSVDKKKDEFISVSAHELKTPLTSIHGFVDLLKDPKVFNNKEQREKFFQIIQEDTSRLGNLITNMLDLSRMDMGTIKFDIEKTNVKELMNSVQNQMDIIIKQKGIKSTFEAVEDLDIMTDQNRVIQVLSNLINNSVHYTAKEGKINVAAKKQDENILFSVTDTGIGIPKAAQIHIFQRFFQVDSSYTRKIGGTGLGLSVSKGIVEALGGKMWFKSIEGKGATFFFALPIKGVQQKNSADVLEQLKNQGYKPVEGLTEEALEEGKLIKTDGQVDREKLKAYQQKGFLQIIKKKDRTDLPAKNHQNQKPLAYKKISKAKRRSKINVQKKKGA